jgi:hypothetical protein
MRRAACQSAAKKNAGASLPGAIVTRKSPTEALRIDLKVCNPYLGDRIGVSRAFHGHHIRMPLYVQRPQNSLVIRGRKISIDEKGRVRLNDIHSAGGFSTNQLPKDWVALVTTTKFIATVAEKRSDKSGPLSKSDVLSVYCVKNGRGGGIWTDPVIALAYAKYLSPSLHFEVNEIFLRHKGGDAKLADETLKRASPEANEWAGVRALGRAKRNELTQTLSALQVKLPAEYAQVTNETYKGLLGKTAKELKEDRGLKKTANLRDAMPTDDLVYLMASEQLAKERIEDEDSRGPQRRSRRRPRRNPRRLRPKTTRLECKGPRAAGRSPPKARARSRSPGRRRRTIPSGQI